TSAYGEPISAENHRNAYDKLLEVGRVYFNMYKNHYADENNKRELFYSDSSNTMSREMIVDFWTNHMDHAGQLNARGVGYIQCVLMKSQGVFREQPYIGIRNRTITLAFRIDNGTGVAECNLEPTIATLEERQARAVALLDF